MVIFRAKSTLLRKEHGQMARAKRHFLPGHVWHITHRCHKKEFLLKFARDRSLLNPYIELYGYFKPYPSYSR